MVESEDETGAVTLSEIADELSCTPLTFFNIRCFLTRGGKRLFVIGTLFCLGAWFATELRTVGKARLMPILISGSASSSATLHTLGIANSLTLAWTRHKSMSAQAMIPKELYV
jgi:hypothetical protein